MHKVILMFDSYQTTLLKRLINYLARTIQGNLYFVKKFGRLIRNVFTMIVARYADPL